MNFTFIPLFKSLVEIQSNNGSSIKVTIVWIVPILSTLSWKMFEACQISAHKIIQITETCLMFHVGG